MTTPQQFVAAARSLLDTPYHVKGRVPGLALDCIGVPIVAGRLCGALAADFDVRGYSDIPDGTLLAQCMGHLRRIEASSMRAGDLVVVRWTGAPQHVGVVSDGRNGGLSMIHADNVRARRVVEHRLWFTGAMRFAAAFRLPAFEGAVSGGAS